MLPPVLPVVIYRGSRKWTAPTDLSSLIESAPGKLSQFVPKVDYLLVEERAIDETVLETMTNFAASVFLIEKTKTLESSVRALLNLFDWLEEAAPANESLKRSILSWFRHVQRSAKLITDGEFETLTIEGLRPMLVDQEEQREKRERELFTRGQKEGREEGREEGRKEGREEGEVKLIQP
jgi:putative YhgA-like transposase